jgi:hypothetical protein
LLAAIKADTEKCQEVIQDDDADTHCYQPALRNRDDDNVDGGTRISSRAVSDGGEVKKQTVPLVGVAR